jgi:flagellar basal-body rod protein FlgC
MTAIGTALSGLQASMARMTASAANIANAGSTGRLPSPAPETPAAAPTSPTAYQPIRTQQSPVPGGGVAASFVPVTPSSITQYDPSSPDANADGMVAAPNVDVTDELVQQLVAKQEFGANLSVIKTSNRMDQSLFEIWA